MFRDIRRVVIGSMMSGSRIALDLDHFFQQFCFCQLVPTLF